MKIKILESGWEGFTGDFGSVAFVDGVSVEDVAPFIAGRLANLIKIETLEGVNPSSSQLALDSTTLPMVVDMPSLVFTQPAEALKVYTREELEALADKGGIAAVRAVAEPLKVKATSLAKLIELVLDAQKPKPVTDPVVTAPAGAETVVSTEAVVTGDSTIEAPADAVDSETIVDAPAATPAEPAAE